MVFFLRLRSPQKANISCWAKLQPIRKVFKRNSSLNSLTLRNSIHFIELTCNSLQAPFLSNLLRVSLSLFVSSLVSEQKWSHVRAISKRVGKKTFLNVEHCVFLSNYPSLLLLFSYHWPQSWYLGFFSYLFKRDMMVGDDNKSFLQTKGLKKVLYGGKKKGRGNWAGLWSKSLMSVLC